MSDDKTQDQDARLVAFARWWARDGSRWAEMVKDNTEAACDLCWVAWSNGADSERQKGANNEK